MRPVSKSHALAFSKSQAKAKAKWRPVSKAHLRAGDEAQRPVSKAQLRAGDEAKAKLRPVSKAKLRHGAEAQDVDTDVDAEIKEVFDKLGEIVDWSLSGRGQGTKQN